MASSQKLISIIFLFTLFSMQIHARELFSKIPSVNNNNEKKTTITPDTQTGYGGLYDHELGQLPPSTTTTTKETYEPYVTPVKYHPDEPYNSILETSNNKNGYAIKETYEPYVTPVKYHSDEPYNSVLATSNNKNGYEIKETNEPYVTPVKYHPEEPYNSIPATSNKKNGYEIKDTYEPYVTPVKYHSDEPYNSILATSNNKNGYEIKDTYEPYVTPVKYHSDEPYNSILATSNNKNGYETSTEQQNSGEDVRFTERGWSTKEDQNNNGYNNGEKRGMSDTRYLENGRYYYDVKKENNYHSNQFNSFNGIASRNEFNENRYSNQDKFEENEEEFKP